MSRANSDSPDIHRKFQFTSLRENSNKVWEILGWKTGGGEWEIETRYCRTGYTPQKSTKTVSAAKLESLIRSKIGKGYREVEMAGAEVSIDTSSVEGEFASMVLREANEYISTYLVGEIGGLSQKQIDYGRQVLEQISRVDKRAVSALIPLTERYYRTIPTKLPSRIQPEQVALDLAADLHEQEDRLNQLEAAIAQTKVPSSELSDVLGCHIRDVTLSEDGCMIIESIVNTVEHSRWSNLYVRRVFEVLIPDERQRFMSRYESTRPKNPLLFHGTKSRNVRHILKSGLIIPKQHTNGSMFGRGIYLADKSSKSLNYSGGGFNSLIVVEADLGRQFRAEDNLDEPPIGYDSVIGVAGRTRSYNGVLMYNEYIVYSRDRVTIRYIAEVR